MTSGPPRCPHAAGRLVITLDLDCFYVQASRKAALAVGLDFYGKPVGIQQKYLCVTSSYEARAHGVGKLEPIAASLKKCPQLVLLDGSDLCYYRKCSDSILAVLNQEVARAKQLCAKKTLCSWIASGPGDAIDTDAAPTAATTPSAPRVVERLVLDEFFIEAGPIVDAQLDIIDAAAANSSSTSGAGGSSSSAADSHFWLPASSSSSSSSSNVPASSPVTCPATASAGCRCIRRVVAAARFCLYLRQRIASMESPLPDGLESSAVKAGAGLQSSDYIPGFTTCGGISGSKLGAKLAVGMHKPNQQTILLPWLVKPLVQSLSSVKALPGCGYATSTALERCGIVSPADVLSLHASNTNSGAPGCSNSSKKQTANLLAQCIAGMIKERLIVARSALPAATTLPNAEGSGHQLSHRHDHHRLDEEEDCGEMPPEEDRRPSKGSSVPALPSVPATALTQATRLLSLCEGLDDSPVVPTHPPSTISDEDSHLGLKTWRAAVRELVLLAVNVLPKLDNDYRCHNGRKPRQMRVTVRQRHEASSAGHAGGSGGDGDELGPWASGRTGKSCPFPESVLPPPLPASTAAVSSSSSSASSLPSADLSSLVQRATALVTPALRLLMELVLPATTPSHAALLRLDQEALEAIVREEVERRRRALLFPVMPGSANHKDLLAASQLSTGSGATAPPSSSASVPPITAGDASLPVPLVIINMAFTNFTGGDGGSSSSSSSSSSSADIRAMFAASASSDRSVAQSKPDQKARERGGSAASGGIKAMFQRLQEATAPASSGPQGRNVGIDNEGDDDCVCVIVNDDDDVSHGQAPLSGVKRGTSAAFGQQTALLTGGKRAKPASSSSSAVTAFFGPSKGKHGHGNEDDEDDDVVVLEDDDDVG